MRRRGFLGLIGGAAAAPMLPPSSAPAQERVGLRRIGALISLDESDPEARARTAVLKKGLQELGWAEGRNVQIDFRWAAGEAERSRAFAAELVALNPQVILANTSMSLAALQRQTRTIPIVFVQVADPVGAGFVASLARPGGNITGFTSTEYAIGGKWLELLKEIMPGVRRVAVLRDPTLAVGVGTLGAMHAVAPALGVEIRPLDLRDTALMEQAIAQSARETNGGLIVLPNPIAMVQRDKIIALAARHRLPAVYWLRVFVASGGLLSYGADQLDLWRRTAGYLDRILKGDKPADLPVQAPTKFELVINLKTAKALGLAMPASLLARADAVIE